MTKCPFCLGEVIKPMRKFCCGKCRGRYHTRINSSSPKRLASQRVYRERHRKELSEKSKLWYSLHKEQAIKKSVDRYYKRKGLALIYYKVWKIRNRKKYERSNRNQTQTI